jgi:hypothetical protein
MGLHGLLGGELYIYPLDRRIGGPQNRSGRRREGKYSYIALTSIRTPFPLAFSQQPFAIATTLSRFLYKALRGHIPEEFNLRWRSAANFTPRMLSPGEKSSLKQLDKRVHGPQSRFWRCALALPRKYLKYEFCLQWVNCLHRWKLCDTVLRGCFICSVVGRRVG